MNARSVVRDALERPDDSTLRRLVEAALADELGDEDVAELAHGLAGSGDRLAPDRRAGDVASTGGPSSLSTLICPLHLRARGVKVPKLGVPGRPAGGIDVLQTVPGFQGALEPNAAQAALERSGYIHLLADERWAPLDARLFAFRQREGAQTVPALVIASILAKKLAAGATGAGLEIRVAPHGNFGGDLDQARRNAHRYNAVAKRLDLRPVSALTDATRPYQPYIGRGEALIALAEVLSGRAREWLADHLLLCQRMADAVAGALGVDTTASAQPAALREAHDALLAVHGAEASSFDDRVEEVRAAPRTIFRAERAGVVEYDLGQMRTLLVGRQQAEAAQDGSPAPDPAGVILEAPASIEVGAEEPLMSVRVPDGEHELAAELGSCVRVRGGTGIAEGAGSTLEII